MNKRIQTKHLLSGKTTRIAGRVAAAVAMTTLVGGAVLVVIPIS